MVQIPPAAPTSSPKPPRRPTSPDGIIVVDKPQGITSHDVVARLRRLCGTRAVGHGGTLDPMATGVLICGIGKGTKLLTYVSGSDKAYTATIRLGIATTTDDAEGEIAAAPSAVFISGNVESNCHSAQGTVVTQTQNLESEITGKQITSEMLLSEIEKLTGEIDQVPTAVSAIKVNGKRAYDLVREGEEVELKARPVTVSEFEVTYIVNAIQDGVPVIDLTVNVVVSSGTYVRALARDLGEALGTGGHLTMLRRTRIGKVDLSQAQTLDQLARFCDSAQNDDGAGEPLPTIPLGEAAALFLPTRTISEFEAGELRQGKFIEKGDTDTVTAALFSPSFCAQSQNPGTLSDSPPELVAIIEPAAASDKAKPKVVFPWEP